MGAFRLVHGSGRRAAALAVGLALLLAPRTVHALGFQLTSPGARANGRAGAIRAGGDSPMVLFYNPAELALVPGYNGVVTTHVHFSQRCMTRVEQDPTTLVLSADQKVCNAGGPGIIPELALSAQLPDHFALALGVFAPPAGIRSSRYGEPETVTIGTDSSGNPIYSPVRYLLIESHLLQAFATIGLAYQPTPAIRFGAAFGWGFTRIDFANTVYDRYPYGAGQVVTDVRINAKGGDNFVPKIWLGVHITPSQDVPFDIGFAFNWTGQVKVTDGRVNINLFNVYTQVDPNPPMAAPAITGTGSTNVEIIVPQPMELSMGLHYYKPLDHPVDTVGDRLSKDAFDVEADLAVALNDKIDHFTALLPPSVTLTSPLGTMPVDLPSSVKLQHHWRTQIGLYLGGDYNVLPGLFALRTGLSVESNGVQDGYQQLDFQPFRRIGFHFGATLRVGHMIDFSVAYAHIFQPEVTVSPSEGQLRRTYVGPMNLMEIGDNQVINAGTYTSRYDVLVVDVGAHF